MRYFKHVLFVSVNLMMFLSLVAQTKSTNNSTAKNQSSKNTSFSQSMDSLKKEFNDLKSVFKGKNKAGEIISISIAGIDYDDVNLSELKENLKTIKGVKGVDMKYKSGNATIEVNFNGKAPDLWDELSQESKQFFKVKDAEDNSIVAQYTNTKKPS